MTFLQALLYFLREALVSSLRSWKVSILAVLTIAVSLFLSGVFLLVAANLSTQVELWRSEARVVVYLEPGAEAEAVAAVEAEAAAPEWVLALEEVTPQEARRRFQQQLPGIAELVEDLPASYEIRYRLTAAEQPKFESWLAELAASPAVEAVDDDRRWLAQLETVIGLARLVGLVLGAVLLGAAVFTIASVIRLTAYLYRDEISIMRLVGATEFFIRGPFWVEGLLQGLAGGLVALGGLAALYHGVLLGSDPSIVRAMLSVRFLTPLEAIVVVLLGGAAGLLGALVSLRREMPSAKASAQAEEAG